MDPSQLLERLARVPHPELRASAAVDAALDESVRFLGSDAARRSIEADVYWPKWDAPWWQMLLLFELGEARRIPEAAIRCMTVALNALDVKTFPFSPAELPPGKDMLHDTLCHCAVGSIYQVLHACGVDVDTELPWMARWLLRYQMADGGLSCDNGAYLVQGECPSSIVGTVAPLEAMLLGSGGPERAGFVEGAGQFLVERRLVLGSLTRHNAEERDSAPSWRSPCFPRFYFYDVLRGLALLARWAEQTERQVPLAAVAPAALHLLDAFPDGVVRLGRRSFDGSGTRVRQDGAWTWLPADLFPLLEVVSAVGEPSPWLTRQWSEVRLRLLRLLAAQRITA